MELGSQAILRWVSEAMVATAFINSGKRWQSGANESSNRRCCDECLGIQWFKNRMDAKILVEEFRRQFREVCANSSLGQ